MKSRVILIDDNNDPRESLKDALEACLTNKEADYAVEAWLKEDLDTILKQNQPTSEGSNATEDIIERALGSEQDIGMVVVDHDLSAFELPITKSAVVAGCRSAMVPVCTYHRTPTNQSVVATVKHIQTQQHSCSVEVFVGDLDEAGTNIVDITGGFSLLDEMVPKIIAEGNAKGPAEIVAELTGRPDQAPYFSNYLESATLMSDILEFAENDQPLIEKKLALVLGYWLYNYVLVYPGILLNDIAAASYLDLSLESLNGSKDFFTKAKYEGPFSGDKEYWWRYDLDDILIEQNADSGYSLLSDKGLQEIEQSTCFRSGQHPAGYYCIANQQAISLEESRGDISWIPSGADLCRIDKGTYEKLSVLLGM